MLITCKTVLATQFENEFEAALPLCEQLTNPNSIPKAPGLNVSTYLKKIESELRAQSSFFKSEEALEFLINRQKSTLDSGTKQCAQWQFEYAQHPQPNKPLEPTLP